MEFLFLFVLYDLCTLALYGSCSDIQSPELRRARIQQRSIEQRVRHHYSWQDFKSRKDANLTFLCSVSIVIVFLTSVGTQM